MLSKFSFFCGVLFHFCFVLWLHLYIIFKCSQILFLFILLLFYLLLHRLCLCFDNLKIGGDVSKMLFSLFFLLDNKKGKSFTHFSETPSPSPTCGYLELLDCTNGKHPALGAVLEHPPATDICILMGAEIRCLHQTF